MISGTTVLGVAALVWLAVSAGLSTASAAVPATSEVVVGKGASPKASSTGTVVSAFATYLAGLESQDQISKDGLERGTSLTLSPIPTGARYGSGDVGGGWHYIVEYFAGSKTIQRAAVLQFVNEHDENADMSPVCDVALEAVRSILIKGGYKEREALGEIGNFLAWEYSKNDITISLLPQATVVMGNQRRDCIRSIRMLG